jgi:hypothetical protein
VPLDSAWKIVIYWYYQVRGGYAHLGNRITARLELCVTPRQVVEELEHQKQIDTYTASILNLRLQEYSEALLNAEFVYYKKQDKL